MSPSSPLTEDRWASLLTNTAGRHGRARSAQAASLLDGWLSSDASAATVCAAVVANRAVYHPNVIGLDRPRSRAARRRDARSSHTASSDKHAPETARSRPSRTSLPNSSIIQPRLNSTDPTSGASSSPISGTHTLAQVPTSLDVFVPVGRESTIKEPEE